MAVGLVLLDSASNALRRIERDLQDTQKKVERARMRAINESLVTARKEAINIIKKDYNITKIKPVRDTVTLVKARRGKLEGAVQAGKDPKKTSIPIVAFGPRQKVRGKRRVGITVQIFRSEARRLLKPAFFAYKKSGVYIRKPGVSRYPIAQRFGPPVTSVFLYNIDEITERAADILAEKIEKRIEQALS